MPALAGVGRAENLRVIEDCLRRCKTTALEPQMIQVLGEHGGAASAAFLEKLDKYPEEARKAAARIKAKGADSFNSRGSADRP
ncbi:MAG: hypothetical protein ABIG68_12595 [Acidobacteriota bacterium]